MSDESLNLNKNLLGGGGEMRMIAYKEGGVLILAVFVRTYYEDDPIAQCTLFI